MTYNNELDSQFQDATLHARAMRKNWSEEFTVPFKLNSVEDSGTFEGVASMFDNLVDTYPPTKVMPGAFKKTLAENFARVKILYQHDLTKPIGLPLTLREDGEGLYIKGELGRSAVAKDVREDLLPLPIARRPILDEMSIGFDPVREEYVKEEGQTEPIRLLREVKLWEISIVTWGADDKAKVRAAHALPFRDLVLAPEATPFDAALALRRVEEWAAGDRKKLAEAFVVDTGRHVDGAWLIADVIDGRLVAVPQAIYAAAHALSKDGLSVSDDAAERIRPHLDRYYRKLGRFAPWDRRRSFLAAALEPMLSAPIESQGFEALTEDDKKLIGDAVALLQMALAGNDEGEPPAQEPGNEGAQALSEDETVEERLLEMEVTAEGISVGLV